MLLCAAFDESSLRIGADWGDTKNQTEKNTPNQTKERWGEKKYSKHSNEKNSIKMSKLCLNKLENI